MLKKSDFSQRRSLRVSKTGCVRARYDGEDTGSSGTKSWIAGKTKKGKKKERKLIGNQGKMN